MQNGCTAVLQLQQGQVLFVRKQSVPLFAGDFTEDATFQ